MFNSVHLKYHKNAETLKWQPSAAWVMQRKAAGDEKESGSPSSRVACHCLEWAGTWCLGWRVLFFGLRTAMLRCCERGLCSGGCRHVKPEALLRMPAPAWWQQALRLLLCILLLAGVPALLNALDTICFLHAPLRFLHMTWPKRFLHRTWTHTRMVLTCAFYTHQSAFYIWECFLHMLSARTTALFTYNLSQVLFT